MIMKLLLLSFYVVWANKMKSRNDTDCSITTHSYMVSILYSDGLDYKPICSGTLLSRNWVLTSGDCIIECTQIPLLYMVVAVSATVAPSLAKYCYVFPKTSRTLDLGLIELETPLELSKLISYVNLATRLDVMDRDFINICQTGVTLGIGRTQPLSCSLSKVLSQDSCRRRRNATNIGIEYLCMSALEEVDICPVMLDEGGPLMCNGVQYGVMTNGHSCSDKEKPVLATRVDKFETYIREIIVDRITDINYIKSDCSINNVITLWYFSLLSIVDFFY